MPDTPIVEDTYSELFKMWAARVLITAEDAKALDAAVNSTVGYATSIIMCPCESGVDVYYPNSETLDRRIGASVMFFSRDEKTLKKELLKRLSQCVLTAPTTAVFNNLESDERTNVGYKISFFGDGWQKKKIVYGREVYSIPMMDGEFLIESEFGISKAVGGGNIIVFGDNQKNTLSAARNAVEAIMKIPYTITPFPGGICRSGSKVGSKYKGLIASINHTHIPLLKSEVKETKVPSNANAAYEIVINGLTIDAIKKAMASAVRVLSESEGVILITSANYGGKLGDSKVYLREL